MGDGNSVFGFELLQQLHNNQIVKKEDVLILFVHWYLTKLGFRCIGIGRSEEFEPSEKGSQLLPEGWNTKQIYELRYIKDENLYLLLGLRTNDEDLLINLWKNQETSSIQLPINQTVTNFHGSLESLIPSYQNIIYTIQKDLINPHLSNNAAKTIKEQSTQTTRHFDPDTNDAASSTDSLRDQRRHRSLVSPTRDIVDVGSADMNPLRRGGGMLFDPFDPLRNQVNRRPGFGPDGRLPPGAIPPYARFDPFSPLDLDQPRQFRNPDDDLFM